MENLKYNREISMRVFQLFPNLRLVDVYRRNGEVLSEDDNYGDNMGFEDMEDES